MLLGHLSGQMTSLRLVSCDDSAQLLSQSLGPIRLAAELEGPDFAELRSNTAFRQQPLWHSQISRPRPISKAGGPYRGQGGWFGAWEAVSLLRTVEQAVEAAHEML